MHEIRVEASARITCTQFTLHEYEPVSNTLHEYRAVYPGHCTIPRPQHTHTRARKTLAEQPQPSDALSRLNESCFRAQQPNPNVAFSMRSEANAWSNGHLGFLEEQLCELR